MIGLASHIGIPDTEAEIGYWMEFLLGTGLYQKQFVDNETWIDDLRLEKLVVRLFDGNTKVTEGSGKCPATSSYKEKVPCVH